MADGWVPPINRKSDRGRRSSFLLGEVQSQEVTLRVRQDECARCCVVGGLEQSCSGEEVPRLPSSVQPAISDLETSNDGRPVWSCFCGSRIPVELSSLTRLFSADSLSKLKDSKKHHSHTRHLCTCSCDPVSRGSLELPLVNQMCCVVGDFQRERSRHMKASHSSFMVQLWKLHRITFAVSYGSKISLTSMSRKEEMNSMS